MVHLKVETDAKSDSIKRGCNDARFSASSDTQQSANETTDAFDSALDGTIEGARENWSEGISEEGDAFDVAVDGSLDNAFASAPKSTLEDELCKLQNNSQSGAFSVSRNCVFAIALELHLWLHLLVHLLMHKFAQTNSSNVRSNGLLEGALDGGLDVALEEARYSSP